MARVGTYTSAVGLWPRFIAGCIDLAILGPLRVGQWLLTAAWGTAGPTFVIPFIMNAAYFTWFWTKWGGATPGKRVVGLRVVDAETGETIDLAAARKRWLGLMCSIATFGFGFAQVISDPHHQALHDRWAKTRVVRGRIYTTAGRRRGIDRRHARIREQGAVSARRLDGRSAGEPRR